MGESRRIRDLICEGGVQVVMSGYRWHPRKVRNLSRRKEYRQGLVIMM